MQLQRQGINVDQWRISNNSAGGSNQHYNASGRNH